MHHCGQRQRPRHQRKPALRSGEYETSCLSVTCVYMHCLPMRVLTHWNMHFAPQRAWGPCLFASTCQVTPSYKYTSILVLGWKSQGDLLGDPPRPANAKNSCPMPDQDVPGVPQRSSRLRIRLNERMYYYLSAAFGSACVPPVSMLEEAKRDCCRTLMWS